MSETRPAISPRFKFPFNAMHERTQRPENQARLDEWIADKGYGWLRWGEKKVFLHRRDMEPRHHRPKAGDVFYFVLGKDAQGRLCAKNAINPRATRPSGILPLFFTPVLMALPVYALHLAGVKHWMIATGSLLISFITYAVYAIDKRRARTGARRIAETSLHLLELLGGWPGAWFAQQRLRHKSSKTSFQIVFWLIIALHQFVAVDWLQQGRWSKWLVAEAKAPLRPELR